MIDRERDIGGERFAYGLAVVPGLGDCEEFEIFAPSGPRCC
jgi:hypothetical protein